MVILQKRYLRKRGDGSYESVQDMFDRVTGALVEVERGYLRERAKRDPSVNVERELKEHRVAFLDALSDFSFVPGGRTLANAGTESALVSNCVVLHIEDSMESIFETLKSAALLQKAGSGLGFPLHLMRPAGWRTKTSEGVASGPISFLHVYNAAFGVIKQANRSGANMGVMRVDHPDVLEFVRCKEIEGSIRCFNISVALTDEFLARARDNDPSIWYCKWNGEKVFPRRIKRGPDMQFVSATPVEMTARELLLEIAHAGWRYGEPGYLFTDEINRANPLPGLGRLEACNPCLPATAWVTTTEGPRQVRELVGKPFEVPSFTEEGVVHACKKGFFSTGVKPVYRVETKQGWVIDATANHRLRLHSGGWKHVEDLEEGDSIWLDTSHPAEWAGDGTDDEGYIVGLIMGGGWIREGESAIMCLWEEEDGSHLGMKAEVDRIMNAAHWVEVSGRKELGMQCRWFLDLLDRFGLTHGDKHPGDLVERASSAFCKGFLRGFFDTDGSVMGQNGYNGCTLRLSQSHLPTLQIVQRMLLRLGIIGQIYPRGKPGEMMPDGKGGQKLHPIQAF